MIEKFVKTAREPLTKAVSSRRTLDCSLREAVVRGKILLGMKNGQKRPKKTVLQAISKLRAEN